ncbi:conserved hypothetical protein [Hyphomicrobiales bacterium]|nr:conserved hypothetical protein [Hyphomicrobiales bacterium]CAH1664158.1 conserved hypothetical protein [Hyphomicrobiales bacterium]
MGYASERAAIEGRWAALWVTGSPVEPRTPTGYEGVTFTPPTAAAWCRLTIRDGEARQVSEGAPGSNVHRHAGAIFVEIFCPGGKGTQALRLLADAAADVFRNARFGGVLCRVPSMSAIREEAPWVSVSMSIPFQRDELF